MSCKTETKQIIEVDNDGQEVTVEYSCTQFSAMKAMNYKLRLIKLLGNAVTQLVPALGSKEANQVEALGKAVNALFEAAQPEELSKLVVEMVTSQSVVRNEKKLTSASEIDMYYSGDNLMALYKVFLFVLQVNYAGFFKGKKAQELLAKAEGNL